MLTMQGLIAVLSLCLTSFGLGYAFGKDTDKTQKQPPCPDKTVTAIADYHIRANRLSVAPFLLILYHTAYMNTTNKTGGCYTSDFTYFALLPARKQLEEQAS